MNKTKMTAQPGKQEILFQRTFDAPRALVFKAYTDPSLIPQWWGPRNLTTTVDRMDVKPGGMWRFVQRDVAGETFAFHGVYHEVKPSEQVIYTFEYEGMPGHVLLETVTFTDLGEQTGVTDQVVFQSLADRDGMLSTGMESGATESMDRFEELLVKA